MLDEVFPTYETALANLREEHIPVTRPILTAPHHSTEDMDAEASGRGLDPTQLPADTGPHPPQTGTGNKEGFQKTTLPYPASTRPPIQGLPLLEVRSQEALATFLLNPRLPGTCSLFMGDIAFLLHLLHDTPDRLAALSCLAQPLPPSKAATVWAC